MFSSKPRLLIFPFDLLAHYLRTLQLADQLKDQYDIQFCASRNYGSFVRQAGYRQFPCKTYDAGRVLEDARRFRFSWLNTTDVQAVINSQIQTIRALRPAAVIGDAMPGLRIATGATGTPFIALLNGYMTRFYQHGRNLPASHPLQKLVGKMPEKWERFLSESGEHVVFRMIQGRFNRLRKQYRLPVLQNYLQELEGDANLICDAAGLFPQRLLPSQFHWLGPLFHQQSRGEDKLLKQLDPNKKTLLVSTGSSGNLEHFSFLNDPRFARYNIIAAGSGAAGFFGAHVMHVPFINMQSVLSKTDLALLHGGNGGLYQALAARVPVLAAPSIFEQEWNVQALERSRAGARLPQNISAEQALALVESWLNKSSTIVFPAVSLSQTLIKFQQIWNTEIAPHIAVSIAT